MTSRIAAAPRRDWTENAQEIAVAVTTALRTPGGTAALRPVQAVALKEISEQRGLFGSIRVGAGKTLITGLAPVVLGSRRPVLLVPANLICKTIEDFETWRRHFKIPHNIRLISYSKLGLETYANLLENYQPDLIMADEAHKLRHVRRSAVARRVMRYLHEHPECRFIALSGTLSNSSLLDYAHMLICALRTRAPVPLDEHALDEWRSILDARGDSDDPTPLIPHLGPITSVTEAREAFRKRLSETPGVIITPASFRGVPLSFRVHKLPEPRGSVEHIERLRKYWEAPDGWSLADQRFEVWAVARQMALGFCYIHDPRPPEDWFAARRAWCRFVRQTIEQGDTYDSEKQVSSACERGELPRTLWDEWQEIRPSFAPQTRPLWFDNSVVEWTAIWGMRKPSGSLIWVEHTAFGNRLAAATGWRYYREGGYDATGRYVEHASPNEPAIVSIKANSEGRNLQHLFWRNLIVSPLNRGSENEQVIGRTHREGQTRAVTVETISIVDENVSCLENAFVDALYAQKTLGQEQKLLIATENER
jgi:hypothetical protein